nr:cyclic nucleotide-binding domain-containing protein [Desulfobulbaceae bacterium]
MDLNELVVILQKIDLFSSFTNDELVSFARSIEELKIEPQTVLFEEGAAGRDMFVLLDGQLQILKENRTITTISPIDYIGEMSIIEDKPRSATVISNTSARLLKITSAQFQKFFSTQPKSLVSMMKTLSRRIRYDTELLAQEFEKANILIHDMRNAITGLLLLDLLETQGMPESQKRFIELMQKSRQHLTEMSNEALSNAKRLHFCPTLESNSLPEIIHDIQEAAFVHPDLKNKQIVAEIDSDFPEFPFYKIDISRAIINLVINAGQASKAGDPILIKLYQQDNQAVVKIIDKGCGIPAEIHSKIFLPHFTTKDSGNGFGLASCKQIIEVKHKGKLSLESPPGCGTTFTFTLPLSPEGFPPQTAIL